MGESIESWLPVEGYEGLYEVSSYGQVRSLLRQTRTGPRCGKVLKPSPNKRGYYRVRLSKDGVACEMFIAPLVLKTFDRPRPDGLEARHLDGDKSNNRLLNLVWGTGSENTLDQVRHGTHWEARMTECSRCGSELTRRPNGHRYCAPCDRRGNAQRAKLNRDRINQRRRELYATKNNLAA